MKAPASDRGPVGPDAAVRGVGNLTSDLLHALRNPVAAFKTSVELLLAGGVDRDDREALERVIRNELVKLNDFLGRCSELTQLSALALAPQDLVAMVKNRLDARQSDVSAAGLTLAPTLAPSAIPVSADESQLGQAIDALLSNAIEWSQAGSSIRVALERAENQAVLTVEDDGKGIAPTALPNVFRLFYTTRKGAAGMGLPLARQIVTGHGGTIEIRSEAGAGTTVTVRIPIANVSA